MAGWLLGLASWLVAGWLVGGLPGLAGRLVAGGLVGRLAGWLVWARLGAAAAMSAQQTEMHAMRLPPPVMVGRSLTKARSLA